METRNAHRGKKRTRVKIIAVLGIIITILVSSHLLGIGEHLTHFVESFKSLGVLGVVIFILVYVIATVIFLPASALTLAAGAVFGLFWGSIYVSIASTAGAATAFLIGRYIARGWVSEQISGNSKFAVIDDAVTKEGWKIVALTRLSPAFPFNLLNYAYGLTNVPFTQYLISSWIAMMPGTVMYVYLGSLANSPQGRTPGQWALLIVGLVATVAATTLVTRTAKKALSQKLD